MPSQPPLVSRGARVVALLALVTLLCAACGPSRVRIKKPGKLLVKVHYTTGGATPATTELMVTAENRLGLTTQRWESLSLRVPESQTTRIRQLLASPDLTAALLRAKGRSANLFEDHRVLLTVNGQEYTLPATGLPREIRVLLEAVDDLYSRTYGVKYSLRIPH